MFKRILCALLYASALCGCNDSVFVDPDELLADEDLLFCGDQESVSIPYATTDLQSIHIYHPLVCNNVYTEPNMPEAFHKECRFDIVDGSKVHIFDDYLDVTLYFDKPEDNAFTIAVTRNDYDFEVLIKADLMYRKVTRYIKAIIEPGGRYDHLNNLWYNPLEAKVTTEFKTIGKIDIKNSSPTPQSTTIKPFQDVYTDVYFAMKHRDEVLFEEDFVFANINIPRISNGETIWVNGDFRIGHYNIESFMQTDYEKTILVPANTHYIGTFSIEYAKLEIPFIIGISRPGTPGERGVKGTLYVTEPVSLKVDNTASPCE